ncbi:NADPH:quinone oxidoreductase family protein [uncultured Jatrophihabitans sp.]|uniref:NADPH:quinone oxidoreductase family protein n=1 Tax=uncultured Jatrophihabitans sp. TaxID=1610747 RepID=UPI0035CADF90
MRAVQIVSLTGPDAVETGEVRDPAPRPRDVLIEVHAAGITYPDVLKTHGRYQLAPELPYVPGSQLSGTVRSAPDDSPFETGQRVCGFAMNGAFAELAAIDSTHVFPLEDSLSWETGAAALTNYLTAHFVLTLRARLAPGETVLVHGAAGGVGLASIQLARALGAQVIAVVSSPDKATAALEAGAFEAVPVDGFSAAARELTDGRGVDVIVDPVGGDRFTDSLRALATGGRLAVVGFVGGDIPTVKVNRLLLTNTEVVGAAWGEYALGHPGYAQQQWQELSPRFVSTELAPRIAEVLPLQRAADGLRLLANREVIGNVVLTLR